MRSATYSIFLSFCLLATSGGVAQHSDLAGTWTGSWVRAGEPLNVVFHFKREAQQWRGSFDSDQLRVVGIPLSDIRVASPAVAWKIVGDETTTTFNGELHGSQLTGTFDDNGTKGTFAFVRALHEESQPDERVVTFSNAATVLAGSVLLPPHRTGKAPGIVFLHGSGAEGRWASRYVATRFARAGFAALIWDKRGVGKSQGDWKTTSLDDFVADAGAAIEKLRSMREVDPDRVGILGHSQGGTLAPLVATRSAHVAFIIGSSASGLPAEDVEVYSIENSIDFASLSSEEASAAHHYVRTFVATVYRGLPHQQLLEMWQKVKGKVWAIEPPPEGDYYWSWSLQWARYDPLRSGVKFVSLFCWFTAPMTSEFPRAPAPRRFPVH